MVAELGREKPRGQDRLGRKNTWSCVPISACAKPSSILAVLPAWMWRWWISRRPERASAWSALKISGRHLGAGQFRRAGWKAKSWQNMPVSTNCRTLGCHGHAGDGDPEYGRSMLGLGDANSSEFDKLTGTPECRPDAGTDESCRNRRNDAAGPLPCDINRKTLAAGLPDRPYQERAATRYEVNNDYRALYEQSGMVFSRLSPDRVLVEIAELKEHPFMIGCQFHPEFLSPYRAAPIVFRFHCCGVARSVGCKSKKIHLLREIFLKLLEYT